MPLGNGLYVNGPDEASPREYIDGVPVRKLFVGNIPDKILEQTIFTKFNKFGDLASVAYKVPKRNSQSASYYKNDHSNNFAFITYKNPESAAKILRGPKICFFNQILKVVAADSWHQPLVNPDGTVLVDSSLWLKNIKNNFVEQPEKTDTLCTNIVEGIENLSIEWAEKSCINKLNDDCLEVIFANVNLESQVNASQVCRRWDAIICNILKKMEIFNPRIEHFNDVNISFQSFEKVLKKIGPYLKTFFDNNVEFDTSSSFKSSIIYFVATYCPNLESLVLASSKIRPRSFTYLAMMCPYLTKLTIFDCENIDLELCQFFNSRNCKLKELKIMNCHIFGQCFKSFPITLECLILDSCDPSAHNLFLQGLEKLKNSLIRLEIRNSSTVQCSSINLHSISVLIPGLKYLSFTHVFHPNEEDFLFNPKIDFFKLESLNLECNGSMSEFLILNVLRSCKELKFLNVTGLNVTESVAKSITELESLEELVISDPLDKAKTGSCSIEDVIKQICTPSTSLNLKKIECQNWDDLSDASVIRLLKRFKELSYLDLSCCQKITNKLLVSALDIVKGRTVFIPLNIDITGTNINNSSLINHPFLKINSKPETDKNKTTNANITNEDINKILNEYSLKKMHQLNAKLNSVLDNSTNNLLRDHYDDFEFHFYNVLELFDGTTDFDGAIEFEFEDDEISVEYDFDDESDDLSDFE